MIDYLIKFVLCSGFFLLMYRLFLQHERMYQFNRCYLLLALVLSSLIPLLNLEHRVDYLEEVVPVIYATDAALDVHLTSVSEGAPQQRSTVSILVYCYLIISVLLLVRVLVLNYLLLRKSAKGKLVSYRNTKFILLEEGESAHSYLNYVFVNEVDFAQGINKGIIDHELAHVRQKHTLDLIFIELLIAIAWWNPFLYFYGHAIRLNHEFIADAEAIKGQKHLADYGQLLLSQTFSGDFSRKINLLSSSFSYLKTKKRLTMMSKNYVKSRIVVKQLLVIPVLSLAILLFSKNMLAQELTPKESEAQSSEESIDDQSLQEPFDRIVNKALKYNNNKVEMHFSLLEQKELEQLKTLYLKMSPAQQARQVVKFERRRYLLNVPGKAEFEKWKNPKLYGVWIDGERVDNEQLTQYVNTDFSYYIQSKLNKNARNYGKHVFQIDLMSNEDFENRNSSQQLFLTPNFSRIVADRP